MQAVQLLSRAHASHPGPERLLRQLARSGLPVDALEAAAALVLWLDTEARVVAELGVPEPVGTHYCGHRLHPGERWLPLTAEHFYTRPGGRPATWCRECIRRDNRERNRARRAGQFDNALAA